MPDFRARVSELNDGTLTRLLERTADDVRGTSHRGLLKMVKAAVTAHLDVQSRWHRSSAALAAIPDWLTALQRMQSASGLFSSDGNLASPPDSGFSVNDMGIVHLLIGAESTPTPALREVRASIAHVMARAADALVRGGVHTPNHRWELASALARLDAVRPDSRLRPRVEQWLAEGVDVGADGLYSERSPNYAAHVTNPSLLTLAEYLDRPDLREIVHANLHAQAALTDADGRVESVHSRRQDQGRVFLAGAFAAHYRRFALLDCCPVCAAAAEVAERQVDSDAADILAEMLLEPALAAPVDPPAPRQSESVVVRYATSGLVRVNRTDGFATVYGGSDVPTQGRIASGLACDPTFLRWRHGTVVLDALRLSRTFFGLGPFRPDGLFVAESGDCPVVRLSETVRASYYQPLPADRRRSDGAYGLEDEGRFSAAMSFAERTDDVVEMTTEMTVTVHPDGLDVDAQCTGAETSYAFELTFRPGGLIGGVQPLSGDQCYELTEGNGSYRVGRDIVTFGPGSGGSDRPPGYDPGSAYTDVGGSDATTGVRVYLPGRSPGRRLLRLRAGLAEGASSCACAGGQE